MRLLFLRVTLLVTRPAKESFAAATLAELVFTAILGGALRAGLSARFLGAFFELIAYYFAQWNMVN